jgi:hypothetical protein
MPNDQLVREFRAAQTATFILKEPPLVTIGILIKLGGIPISRDFNGMESVDVIPRTFQWKDGPFLFFRIVNGEAIPIEPHCTFEELRLTPSVLISSATKPESDLSPQVVVHAEPETRVRVWESPRDDLDRAAQRVVILRTAQGPGVVRIFGDTRDDRRVTVTTETVKEIGQDPELRTVLCAVARTLCRLHANSIVLNTLTRADVGFNEQGEPVIHGFENAQIWSADSAVLPITEFPESCAPGLMNGSDSGPSVDVWSFGGLLCELVTGRELTRADLAPKGQLAIEGLQESPYQEIAKKCLAKIRKRRPAMQDVLRDLEAIP